MGYREHKRTLFGRGERDFRWRGGDVSRLEGLSDAVFALALTLIVVSLEVPRTYADMVEAFVQIPVFLVCFALLFLVWHAHFQFHRRYGLEDPWTIFLNAVLLFVVLLYVYPLKFLFSLLYNYLVLRRGPYVRDASGDELIEGGERLPILDMAENMQPLMIVYSVGFTLLWLLLALMTRHAGKRADGLELDARERELTRLTIINHMIPVTFGIASIAFALLGGVWVGVSGMIYMFLGVAHTVHGRRTVKAMKPLRPE
ncbi:MAG: DUF1211 domain-containing protein [bacterium]|nr:DUF1211 domain-containing protein [bacterium]